MIVDMHAEITSEKMAMGHFCDGRASLVVGTHTHVPTADAQVLPGGTAYQTDAGGCCDYDSVIGMAKEESVRRFATRLPGRQAHARGRPGHGVRRVRGDRRQDGAGQARGADPHRRPAAAARAGALSPERRKARGVAPAGLADAV